MGGVVRNVYQVFELAKAIIFISDHISGFLRAQIKPSYMW